MEVNQVTVSKRQEDLGNALSDTLYRTCLFCEKIVRVTPQNFKSCSRLSGKKRFFCPFCLRNNMQLRSSKNVLIMSYRGLIGTYYHNNYLKGTGPQKMWLNQIEGYIARHQFVGLRNPVFSYDPDTYLWFVDFNRVGKDPDKAPIEEVMATAKLILLCFRLKEHCGEYAFNLVWEKFEKAIDLFFRQRKRPTDRRMLIPTMAKSGNQESKTLEIRNFLPSMFELK